GQEGLVGGVDGPPVGAQRCVDLCLITQQAARGVLDHGAYRLDVVPEGDAHDPTGTQGEDDHDHGDCDRCTEGGLFEAHQEQRVRELAELDVELGHHDRDPDDHEGVVDPHQVQAKEQSDQDHRDRPVGVVTDGFGNQRTNPDAHDRTCYPKERFTDLFARVVNTHEGDEHRDHRPVEAVTGHDNAQRCGDA